MFAFYARFISILALFSVGRLPAIRHKINEWTFAPLDESPRLRHIQLSQRYWNRDSDE